VNGQKPDALRRRRTLHRLVGGLFRY
jgi:hypothetical protein